MKKYNFEKVLNLGYTITKPEDFTFKIDIKLELIPPLHFTLEV